MNILYNLNQDGNSLQVSVLEDIPAGDFKVPKGHLCLLKILQMIL